MIMWGMVVDGRTLFSEKFFFFMLLSNSVRRVVVYAELGHGSYSYRISVAYLIDSFYLRIDKGKKVIFFQR